MECATRFSCSGMLGACLIYGTIGIVGIFGLCMAFSAGYKNVSAGEVALYFLVPLFVSCNGCMVVLRNMIKQCGVAEGRELFLGGESVCPVSYTHLSETDIPIFAICLGHQLMALAYGAKTYKLKYGHRGGNHPVKDLSTGRVYISSQNHGYAVDYNTMDKNVAEEAFINVNDLSLIHI